MDVTLREPRTLTLCCEEIPLLRASLLLPQCPRRRFGRYYDRCARRWEAHCRQTLFPRLESTFHRACESAAPLPWWELQCDCRLYPLTERHTSVVRELCLTGDGRPQRSRRAEVWDTEADFPLTLRELFPARRWRAPLLAAAAAALDREPRTLLPHLRQDCFYLTETHLHLFFPTLGYIAVALPLPELGVTLPG